MISKHHNWDFSAGIPTATGDRYYAQDLLRDFWHNKDSAGLTGKDLLNGPGKCILSGGGISHGSDPANDINISELLAYTKYLVTLPDSFASLPPTTKTEDVEFIRLSLAAQTNLDCSTYGATLDGATVNYVKISYSESNGNSRTRAKKAGSYNYEKGQSATIVISSVAPTDYEICLGTVKGNGIADLTIEATGRTAYKNAEQPEIVITSQEEFEYWFGTGTETVNGITGGGFAYTISGGIVTVVVPSNISFYLKSNPSDGVTTHFKYDASSFPYKAYKLKTKLKLSQSNKLIGSGIDQTIIIIDNNDNYFTTDSLVGATDNITSWATNIFTMDSAGLAGVFKPGMIVHNSIDGEIYEVINQSSNTVTVDRTITGASGNATLKALSQNIIIDGLTIDGRGNIHNLGGSRNGRAFNLNFCAHSIFKGKVINCNFTGDGAGYTTNSTCAYLNIENVHHCTASGDGGAIQGDLKHSKVKKIYYCSATNGGGISSISYSHIKKIKYCYASQYGGGVYGCSNCHNIDDIYQCNADLRGGGVHSCDYSIISNIKKCYCSSISSGQGGGLYGCSYCNITNVIDCYVNTGNASAYGGGLSTCSYCVIKNVLGCYAKETTGNAYGGGCYLCDHCNIDFVKSCYVETTTGVASGGGCYSCNDSTISNLYSNSAAATTDLDGVGGGCSICGTVANPSTFLGVLLGNTCNGGVPDYDTLDDCYGVAYTVVDATNGVAVFGAINFD